MAIPDGECAPDVPLLEWRDSVDVSHVAYVGPETIIVGHEVDGRFREKFSAQGRELVRVLTDERSRTIDVFRDPSRSEEFWGAVAGALPVPIRRKPTIFSIRCSTEESRDRLLDLLQRGLGPQFLRVRYPFPPARIVIATAVKMGVPLLLAALLTASAVDADSGRPPDPDGPAPFVMDFLYPLLATIGPFGLWIIAALSAGSVGAAGARRLKRPPFSIRLERSTSIAKKGQDASTPL